MVVSHIQSRAAIIAPRNGITLPTNRKAYSPQHGCRYRPRLMTNQERIVTRVHNEVEQRTGEATDEEKPFLDELRQYAMKLHTREQAPAEGQAEAPKDQKPFVPTKQGYLRFMEESKIVYDAFETIVASDPTYEGLRNNGLERGDALAEDIQYAVNTWGLTACSPSADSPGAQYASLLRELSESSPPAFICHYYNYYFAHTAGGRMIGKQVSEAVLDGWLGKFYQWEGNVRDHLDKVREVLNAMATGWSQQEKTACLEETPKTFQMSGSLLRLIAEQ
ncbi:hypothetical protein M9434_002407 [Picochlorum sp. BPE23]|nr:hypothetical protein M9434_002407 [Picochlorum sp. BPE23]